MDNLTHVLTGLAISRAGLGRWTTYAPWVLILSANGPDCDVITWLAGSVTYLQYHRHFTHAWPFVPLVALWPVVLMALVARIRGRKFQWMRAWLLSLIGVSSHLLLDWTNIYGIRWLLPFRSDWYRLDAINVVDLWIWAVLIGTSLWPLLSRLVSGEIGARPPSGRGAAIFALCFLAVYGFARHLLHQRAILTLEARLYRGAAPVRVAAVPALVNPFHWIGLVETETFHSAHEMNLLEDFDPTRGTVFYKPAPSPAMEAAKATKVFRVFLDFSRDPVWRITPTADPENGARVDAMDLRFGYPPETGTFTASAIVDAGWKVRRAWFQFGGPEP
jgi:inner membrane protein